MINNNFMLKSDSWSSGIKSSTNIITWSSWRYGYLIFQPLHNTSRFWPCYLCLHWTFLVMWNNCNTIRMLNVWNEMKQVRDITKDQLFTGNLW